MLFSSHTSWVTEIITFKNQPFGVLACICCTNIELIIRDYPFLSFETISDLFLPHADPNTIIRNEVVEKRDEIVSLKSDISRMNNEIDDLLRKIESSKNKALDQDEFSNASEGSGVVELSKQLTETSPISAE